MGCFNGWSWSRVDPNQFRCSGYVARSSLEPDASVLSWAGTTEHPMRPKHRAQVWPPAPVPPPLLLALLHFTELHVHARRRQRIRAPGRLQGHCVRGDHEGQSPCAAPHGAPHAAVVIPAGGPPVRQGAVLCVGAQACGLLVLLWFSCDRMGLQCRW